MVIVNLHYISGLKAGSLSGYDMRREVSFDVGLLLFTEAEDNLSHL